MDRKNLKTNDESNTQQTKYPKKFTHSQIEEIKKSKRIKNRNQKRRAINPMK